MIPAPIRHAWRTLCRTPVFTIAAALTLALGTGAVVAMFAVVNGVLLQPLPYGSPDRLAGAFHDMPPVSVHKAPQTPATYFTYKRLARSVKNIGIYQNGSVNISDPSGSSQPRHVASAGVSASLIPTLEVPPLLGRVFSEAEDLPNGPLAVMISEGYWRGQYASDPHIVGRTIVVNGSTRQIIGVMPARFRFPTAQTQIWTPLRLDPAALYGGGFSYSSVVRLQAGVSLADAEREMISLVPRVPELYPSLAPGVSMRMLLDQAKPRPFLIPLREDVTGEISGTLWMVAGAAALVLLVACANVANLVLVRADARQREIAVREALGAGRARVLAHFFGESAILAAIAGVAGLAIAWAAVRALVRSGPAEIPRLAELGIDVTTIAFTMMVTAGVALVCSVMPALRIGRSRLSLALREGGRGGTAGKAQSRLRGAMVAVQIALALVVLAIAGLLTRTFRELHAVSPGFDASRVATFWLTLPSARYADDASVVRFHAALTDRVRQLPGVASVGLSSRLPLLERGVSQDPFYAEGDESSTSKIPPLQLYTTIDDGYMKTMGIPIIAGRGFVRTGTQRDIEAIVSRPTAEQFWKDATGRAAVGKRFRRLPGSPLYTVIGVAGDVRDTALAAPPAQTVYFPQAVPSDTLYPGPDRRMALVVKTTGEATVITTAVQQAVRELDPTLPVFDVQSMPAVLRASTARLTFTIAILGAAAVVALLLGAIGLYGAMAYLVTLRMRELGVRIALGAQPRSIAMMMTRQGLVLTAIGVGAGLLVFALVARSLRSFLYGVAPGDPLTLVSASVLLVATALVASWIPARKAASVDPADSLRAE